jgi:hypothetical protein
MSSEDELYKEYSFDCVLMFFLHEEGKLSMKHDGTHWYCFDKLVFVLCIKDYDYEVRGREFPVRRFSFGPFYIEIEKETCSIKL